MKHAPLVAAATLAAALVAAPASRAGAQGAPMSQPPMAQPVHFGLAVGGTIPMSDMSDAYDAGFHVAGLAEYRATPVSPFGVRAEVAFHPLTGKSASFNDGTTNFSAKIDNLAMFTGTLDGVAHLSTNRAASVSPYLLGGIGFYRYKLGVSGDFGEGSFSASTRETKFGLNGGVGTSFRSSGHEFFLEARYHYIFTGSSDNADNADISSSGAKFQFVPISVGLMF